MGSIATIVEDDEAPEGYIVTSQDVYMVRSNSALARDQNEFDVMVRQVSANHDLSVEFLLNKRQTGGLDSS